MSEGYTVRTTYTTDRVYLIQDGKRAWVKNPQTLEKLGFVLGEEKTIPYEELLGFVEMEALDLSVSSPSTAPTSEVPPIEQEDDAKIEAILGYRGSF